MAGSEGWTENHEQGTVAYPQRMRRPVDADKHAVDCFARALRETPNHGNVAPRPPTSIDELAGHRQVCGYHNMLHVKNPDASLDMPATAWIDAGHVRVFMNGCRPERRSPRRGRSGTMQD